MHVAIVTAGGAGMFCGSCMHDNTWARALMDAGVDVSLIPMYTPIRVDEADVSSKPVFFGGINVYLDYQIPFWKRLPRFLVHWLDKPWVIKAATKFSARNDAKTLGPLTLAMLEGADGPHVHEVEEFVDFVTTKLKPDVIFFTNALLSGVMPRLRAAYDGKLLCILQGDDIFLDDLPERHRTAAIAKISENCVHFDGFLVHSDYYRDFTSEYLGLPAEKYHRIPLGIDLTGHDGEAADRGNERFTVGYFARICPEKGLHQLVDAVVRLRERHPEVRLRAGGYLGARDKAYFHEVERSAAVLADDFEFIGSPATHDEKVAFLKSIDVLSVPTTYREPKGLYVLESLANGTPVVQPAHGSFPELVEATAGGLLVEPGDTDALANAIESLIHDRDQRLELARVGQQRVRERFGPEAMVGETMAMLERVGAAPRQG